ncbi:MAG: hypothetical protein HYT16_01815 [DPANN group archaeon]|nr:hypothetical protein [DPANN group archaeon]
MAQIVRDLQAIVDGWPEQLNERPNPRERIVLGIMRTHANKVGDVTMPMYALVDKAEEAGIHESELNELLRTLGTDRNSKNCVEQAGFGYALRAAGWAVFESRRSVLTRLVLKLAEIHKVMQYRRINPTFISKEMRFGRYNITGFYLRQLGEGIVREEVLVEDGRKKYNYVLTQLGGELARYLGQQ